MRRGEIAPGDVIAEATSGNTGISFAAIGRALGHPVRIYMPDWMSRERVLVIQSLGAAVIPVSAELGGFLGSIRMADDFAREAGRVFRPQQFDNTANVQAHYETTGPEITAQLATLGRKPTAFVAGVGTGGTVMGVAQHLRENFGGRRGASARAREFARRCAPVTRSAGIASRASATNSCPPSSSWASWAASSTSGTATPS